MSDDWRLRAACRGMAPADGRTQPHPFFPETKGEAAAIAESVCAGCLVREPCAATGQRQLGVWGGKLHRKLAADQSAAAKNQFETAAEVRDAVHRAFMRGDTVPAMAATMRQTRRNIYRHLGTSCSSSSCWCRRRSTVPLEVWTEAAG